MVIQQTDNPVESTESFPADENSSYPPKSTVRVIVSLTVGIAIMAMLFALAGSHPGHQPDSPTPPSQEQPSPPGAHDQ